MAGYDLVVTDLEDGVSVAECVAQTTAEHLNRWLHENCRRFAAEFVAEHHPELVGDERDRRVQEIATDAALEWSESDAPAAAVASVRQHLVRRGMWPAESNAPTRARVRQPILSAQRHAPRRRGAGRPAVRGASRRSSARSGDSGDDADGEPDAPDTDARRECRGCGADISHRRSDAKFCSAKCKQRGWRGGHTSRPDPDPYLELAVVDLEWLQRRVYEGCRCNGGPVTRKAGEAIYVRGDSHLLDATDGSCAKCGHGRITTVAPYYVELWRRVVGRSPVPAASAERDHERPLEVTA
ncbi:MAG: hypothetical protein ACLPV4_19340 [Solirubrobacteraceae bacterium]